MFSKLAQSSITAMF
ncbi:hypothetical protein [Escherichia coli]|nr:hypothetical protein [Escherichia coli]